MRRSSGSKGVLQEVLGRNVVLEKQPGMGQNQLGLQPATREENVDQPAGQTGDLPLGQQIEIARAGRPSSISSIFRSDCGSRSAQSLTARARMNASGWDSPSVFAPGAAENFLGLSQVALRANLVQLRVRPSATRKSATSGSSATNSEPRSHKTSL